MKIINCKLIKNVGLFIPLKGEFADQNLSYVYEDKRQIQTKLVKTKHFF